MTTYGSSLSGVGIFRRVAFVLLLAVLGGSLVVFGHGEVPGAGALNFTRTLTAKDGSRYRVDLMYSPSLPTAGEPANVSVTVKRLLATPDPLLGSEVAVTEEPAGALLSPDGKSVVVAHLPVHPEGEAGVYGVAEYRFPKGGSFMLRFTIHAQSGEALTLDLPISVQANAAVFFRYWVNAALAILFLGLTGARVWKVRARGGAGLALARPALIGLVSMVAVMFLADRFVLGAVLDLRKVKAVEGPESEVETNKDGTYTIPASMQQQQGISTIEIKPVALRQTVMAYATIEARPDLTALVQAPLWGRIEFAKGPLAVGEVVKKGQPLVEVVLELNALERGLLEQKDVDLKGALARARQRRDAARLEYSRTQALRAKDPTFEPDVQWAKQLFDEATAQYSEIARQDQGYQATMKSRDPRRTPVNAPLSGVITTVDFVPGEVNQTDNYRQLFTIVDTTRVWARAQVYLSDVMKLKDGETVRVYPENASEKVIAGQVRWISETIDPVNRSAVVLVDVPNENRLLGLGSFVRVEFEQKREVLAVPESAVVDEGIMRWVYVARSEGIFAPVPVQMGAKHDGWWEVRSGLMEGDRVVATGAALLGSMPKPEMPTVDDALPTPTAQLAPDAEGAKP